MKNNALQELQETLHPGFPPTHNEVGGATPKLL